MTDFLVNKTIISTPGKGAFEGGLYGSTYYVEGSLAAATAIVTGNTITPPTASGFGLLRISLAGAATGVIVAPGTYHGQLFFLIITSAAANTATMAASGTSNVAGGTTVVLAGLEAKLFVWDAVSALWYIVGPVAN